jgi:galactokinase
VDSAEVAKTFEGVFGRDPEIETRAPGRVNLIGEHTDYNDGFVFPADIDRWMWVLAARRTDDQVSAYSADFGQKTSFALTDIRRDERTPWSNYVRGVLDQFLKRGDHPVGMDLLVVGNVPIGAGLSSSAALEVATAETCRVLSSIEIDPVSLALLCQRAEREFVGVQCGIMDQFVSTLGKENSALLLDCRDLSYRLVELNAAVRIVICNTRKQRSLEGSEYNRRRSECEGAVDLLNDRLGNIKALRDVTPTQLEQNREILPDLNFRRARHVVHENDRVLQAVDALGRKDLTTFGRLMYDSHASLRDDYEVSCPELDLMVELASEQPGTVGARMTGAGFGGCTVNLVHGEALEDFKAGIAEEYGARTGVKPFIYVCSPSQGVAHRLC